MKLVKAQKCRTLYYNC